MDLSQLQRPPMGPATRALAEIAGTDPDVLAKCPQRDVGNVMCVAYLLLAVWAWQSCAFVLVGHLMLAKDGAFSLLVTLGGIGIATIVMLMDSYVIVRSSWHLQGLKELKRGGLEIPGMLSARIANAFFIAVRLFLSLVLAQIVAIFFSLLLYQKDIAIELEAEHQRLNAPLIARVTEHMDDGIAKARDHVEAMRRQLSGTITEEERLRRVAVDPSLDDPEVQVALQRIEALSKAKSEAEKVLRDAQKFAADELGGVRGAIGNTGIPGPGHVRAAALERVRNAAANLAKASRDLTEAESRLATLRNTTQGTARQRKDAATARLGDVAGSRQDLTQRQRQAEEVLSDLTRNREASVRRAVEADPGFKSQGTGFLAHWQGLRRLAADPYVLMLVILLELALFGIELAAVLSKITTFVPATYATLIAQDDLLRVHQAAHDLASSLRALQEGQEKVQGEQPDREDHEENADDPRPPEDATERDARHGDEPETGNAGAQSEHDADGDRAAADGKADQEDAPRPKGQRRPRGSRARPEFSGVEGKNSARPASEEKATLETYG